MYEILNDQGKLIECKSRFVTHYVLKEFADAKGKKNKQYLPLWENLPVTCPQMIGSNEDPSKPFFHLWKMRKQTNNVKIVMEEKKQQTNTLHIQ